MLKEGMGGLLLYLSVAAFAQSAQIAVIIDDMGTSWKQAARVLKLPSAVAASILPFTPYAKKIAILAKQQGRAVLLHAPMEADGHNELLGPGALTISMSRWELLSQLRQNIVSIPGVEGVNNHMGSLMTQDEDTMRWVMGMLWWQDLYFVDSRTSVGSVAEPVAKSMGVLSTHRDVFLDHDVSEEAIIYQFHRLVRLAKQRGFALAIAHPHPQTLNVLEKLLPLLSKQGVQLVPVSTFLFDGPRSLDIEHTSNVAVLSK